MAVHRAILFFGVATHATVCCRGNELKAIVWSEFYDFASRAFEIKLVQRELEGYCQI